MPWFEPFAPPSDLRTTLACRYEAIAEGRHDLIPDGCMDLLWAEGVGVVLCGPDTRAWSFELPAGTSVVGVRFRPGAAAGVFRLDASDVVDERVGLADLVGAAAARRVDERIGAGRDPAERLGVLEELVRGRVGRDPDDDTVALAALVAGDPAYGVDGLAGAAGLSTRQLRRRFDRDVGYGPAFYARIARLQRFARRAARSSRLGLAELAAGAGYADQAHLAKDCRAIAGMTPGDLRDALPRTSVAVEIPVVPVLSFESGPMPRHLKDRTGGRSVQDVPGPARGSWMA